MIDASVSPKHPRLVLATCILASSLAFVDGSVVNVGLSTIGRNLRSGSGGLQWMVAAYLLPLSALLLLGGAAGDRYGRRRMLIIGTSVFAAASLLCSIAPVLHVFLAGRFIQGAGAAMLMPSSLAILSANFTGPARGRAIGIWAASGAAMGALGPLLGGWLIDHVSWRAIFLINLPLAACAITLAVLAIPVDRSGSDRRLDALGGLLATLALGASTWALTTGAGAKGWTLSAIVAALAAGVLAAAFIVVERYRGDQAMTPMSLFASRPFVGLTLLTLLLYGSLGGLLVTLPYVLIVAAGYNHTQAGAALLPLPIMLAIGSPFMGALAGRIGSRLPLTIGPLVVAAGFALMLRVDGQGSYWLTVLPAILVIALGMSCSAAPLTTAVLGSVDDRYTGSASGLNSAVARTGGLLATALVGMVLGAHGLALISGFHLACLVAACLCLGASVAARAVR